MILANMTALTFLDLSGLLINKLLVVFDSCEVLGTLCSGLMSVMFINKLPVVFDACEVCGMFLKLDVSDPEPLTAVRCLVYFASLMAVILNL